MKKNITLIHYYPPLKTILPPAPTPQNPVIKITDIVPQAHRQSKGFDKSRSAELDMDLYRCLLNGAADKFAYERAVQYLRPRKSQGELPTSGNARRILRICSSILSLLSCAFSWLSLANICAYFSFILTVTLERLAPAVEQGSLVRIPPRPGKGFEHLLFIMQGAIEDAWFKNTIFIPHASIMFTSQKGWKVF